MHISKLSICIAALLIGLPHHVPVEGTDDGASGLERLQ